MTDEPDELDEVIHEFVVESVESMDELDRDLVSLERSATPDSLARIFRAIHTVKGTSGFLGFARLEAITHVGENLLSGLRDGALQVDHETTTALLSMADVVRSILESIERTGEEAEGDDAELVATLSRLAAGPARAPGATEGAGDEPDSGPGELDADEPVEADAEPVEADAEPAGAAPEARAAGSESIRVDVGLLDDLMNLVGELVLARNQILQHATPDLDAGFLATTQRLDLITTELQEGVMRTRMQPIENVWSKFPRIVRDLSLTCGKRARLVMEGRHTELDKSLLESIKDPLTHLVRNCVDHGLETPEQRAAAGKPAEGTVRLRAYHEGGQVIIEIGDDGRGIDPAAVRAKAAERGLFGRRANDRRFDDRDVIGLIFEPGFSTAEQVTNISGRGVGMDVVRTNIEGIGGTVDVQSTVGEGTVFKIKIPLTLAIIPALVVTCDGDRFAIPQVSLRELVRIDGHDPRAAIEHVHGAPIHRLRGRILPIVHLRDVFGAERRDEGPDVNIVVVHADGREFGLVVDEIDDTAEIVVKPLGRILKQVAAFAGATIMGDGRVALILDVLGIAESIGLPPQERLDDAEGPDAATAGSCRLLMLRVGDRRLGLPLSTVARLEEFAADRLELTRDRRVVQYRGRILELAFLADVLGIESTRRPDDALQVVVCTAGGRDVGLVVDDISDIVEHPIDDGAGEPPGASAASIVQGRVTDVVDVDAVVRAALPLPVGEGAAA